MHQNISKSQNQIHFNIKNLVISAVILFISVSFAGAHEPEKTNNDAQAQNRDYIVIGQNEQVIVRKPDSDKEVQVLAKIDTGADRTSIGTKIAKTLELDLESARRVKVISGTGEEERPIVDVTIQLAGETIKTAVSVTDRAELSTQMIVGKDALLGFLVNTGQDQVTSPLVEVILTEDKEASSKNEAASQKDKKSISANKTSPANDNNSSLEKQENSTENQARNSTVIQKLRSILKTNVISLSPEALLALIPLAAVLVVLFRTLIGLTTYGIFAPILIALSFTETGVILGSSMFLLVLAAGIAMQPLLRAFRVSRTARLAVLLTTVVLTLIAIKAMLNYAALGAVLTAAFPAVITVAVIEQLWERWEQEGLRQAIVIALWTSIMIVLTGFILTIEPFQVLATRNPIIIAAASVILCLLLGRYRGLRFTELRRFEPEILKHKSFIPRNGSLDIKNYKIVKQPKENPLGMNARNDIILLQNPSMAIFQVNNKFQAKIALEKAGIPITPTLKVVHNRMELRDFDWSSLPDAWALKPNCGKGGTGILLAFKRDKDGKGWLTGSGELLTQAYIKEHIHLILEGEFSMNGLEMDWALFEPLIEADDVLARLVPYGLPDIRVICNRDEPILAMTRLPTKKSEGRANLHQNAIGAGIDIATGQLTQAYYQNRYIEEHPDTNQKFKGVTIPEWEKILSASAACSKATGLGYLGVDVVIDKKLGPMIIEVNAHPGLEIQNVTKQGLVELINKVG